MRSSTGGRGRPRARSNGCELARDGQPFDGLGHLVVTEPRNAYAGGAESWHADAALVYRPLAAHLLTRSPLPLAGARALDAGTGSGIAADALRGAGARVVVVDLSAAQIECLKIRIAAYR